MNAHASNSDSHGGFTADWLTLREPADASARSDRLAKEVFRHVNVDGSAFHGIDLGTGTGADIRYLAMRGPERQSWLGVDDDRRLLEVVPEHMLAWADREGWSASVESGDVVLSRGGRACRVVVRQMNLNEFVGATGADISRGVQLVAASALLDLVSERWLKALAERCRAAHVAALFALTYDGRIDCDPDDPDDSRVQMLVNRHQRTDKGFGPALGPAATGEASGIFAAMGYRIERDRSDWRLPPDSARLQRQLIDGWAAAACALEPGERSAVEQWRMRRLAHVEQGRSTITVGHEDVAAWFE